MKMTPVQIRRRGHFCRQNTIPSKVGYIGSYAFNNCENLTGISLPESVTMNRKKSVCQL